MIEIKELCVSYGKNKVLDNISLTLNNADITCICGKNGSGKSSLLNAAKNLIPYSGTITADGADISSFSQRELAGRISLLPQILPSPALSVKELVLLGRYPYTGFSRIPSQKDREKADEMIALCGLCALAQRSVCTLSGGERQRAFFAMILCSDTDNILLDEPTSYMDLDCIRQFYDFIRLLKQKGKAVAVVMHDIPAALELADRLVFINEGNCVEFGSSDECIDSGIINKLFGVNIRKVIVDDKERYL